MDYGFSMDFKVSTFQDKFGLTGYAVLVKLFESYIEMPSFSIDIGLESVAISYLSRYIPMPKKRVIFYLQGMLECGLLLEDENGLLFSKRMQEHLTKTLEKHQHYVDGNTGKNIKQPEQICNKQGTNQKQTEKQTCVKTAQVDTELSKNGSQIKQQIEAILTEAKGSPAGLVRNKTGTLSNKQIDALIDKYGYSKLSVMCRLYYEWKITSKRQIKDDNLAIQKNWVEEKAEEYINKHSDKQGGNPPIPDYDNQIRQEKKEKADNFKAEQELIDKLNSVKWNDHNSYEALVRHIANFPTAESIKAYKDTLPNQLRALVDKYPLMSFILHKCPSNIDEQYQTIKGGQK